MTPLRSSPLRLALVAAAIVGAAACAHLLQKPAGHFTFSHQLHAKEMEVACAKCHADLPATTEVEQRHLPAFDVCLQCHEDGHVGEADCTACHASPATLKEAAATQAIPAPTPRDTHLNFSHKNHLGRVDGDCSVCHEAMLTSTEPGDGKTPTMATCMQCHQAQYDAFQCRQCHADLSEPRFQPQLARFRHQGDWLHNHKLQAQEANAAACAQCHMERFCSDCHSGVDNQVKASVKWPAEVGRELVHRGDYVTRHPEDVRRDPQPCLSCHRINTCTDCHERAGVRYIAGNANPFGVNNHPFGDEIATSGHGIGSHPENRSIIRRNIVACAACHDSKAPVCTTCHASVGGAGINPHPPGFRSDFNRNRQPVCRTCHK